MVQRGPEGTLGVTNTPGEATGLQRVEIDVSCTGCIEATGLSPAARGLVPHAPVCLSVLPRNDLQTRDRHRRGDGAFRDPGHGGTGGSGAVVRE